MISKIRKIVRRWLRRRRAGCSPSVKFYLRNGNLKLGTNCNVDSLTIKIYGARKKTINIVIGDNCYLMGNIVLHQPKAMVSINDRVFIGPNTTLFCYDSIKIDSDVMISWGCTLIDTNAHSLISLERSNDVLAWSKGWEYKDWSVVKSEMIKVKEKSWVGFNSIICKGVELATGTVVGAGSVVTKSTQPFTIVGGNPAVFIKETR